MEQIKNDQLTLEISPLGAELQSIKDADGNEYLWDGDEKYWNRHSPILFPIVCGLWKDTYRIDGKEYKLSRHGFARDTEFALVGKTADRLTFALLDTEVSHKVYPYRFNLAISYRLEGNEIHVIWHVENTDDKEIFFQIGGHPAFLVPGCKKGEPMHATLKLDNEAPVRLFGNVGGCIDRQAKETVETNKGIWEVDEETFADDAVIFDKSQVKQVSILNEQGEPHVTLEFKTPALGIWNPTGKHAPFICIEPWYGIHDWAEFDGEFKDKYLMNRLQPGASFMSEYIIRIEK
nr:aldose 1-epimerase family protein [uncultured Prevotella sp.]